MTVERLAQNHGVLYRVELKESLSLLYSKVVLLNFHLEGSKTLTLLPKNSKKYHEIIPSLIRQ